MSHITAVDLIGPVIPWAMVASLAIGNVLVLLMAAVGVFNYLTLENPLTYVLLVSMDSFVVAYWPMKWVRVEYLDPHDQPGRAYFTAASMLERWTGGPKRLCALLRRQSGQAEQGDRLRAK